MKNEEAKIKKPIKVYVKYTLLQIPALIIVIAISLAGQKYMSFPPYIKYITVSLWILKDILMFSRVWIAYDSTPENHFHSMVGRVGVALENLNPQGYIRVGGERWRAEMEDNDSFAEKEQKVVVTEMIGLTLKVRAKD